MSIDQPHSLNFDVALDPTRNVIKNEAEAGLVYTYRTSHTKNGEKTNNVVAHSLYDEVQEMWLPDGETIQEGEETSSIEANCLVLSGLRQTGEQNQRLTAAHQWNYRKKVYSNTNRYCETDLIYNRRSHTMDNAGCKCYSCSRCRPLRKKRLLNAVIDATDKHGLTRLLTITFPGEKLRKRVTPDESFTYTMKKFNHVKEYIKRELGFKIEYVNFVRSQNNGYCHLHVLIDHYIPKRVISDICRRLGLGSTNIKYVDVHRVGAYLKAELNNKDHEWYIPKNKKHYTKSRGVSLDFGEGDECYFIEFPKYFSINQKIDKVYDVVNLIANRPPPLDFLVGMFQDVVNVTTNDWRHSARSGYCWVYLAVNSTGALMPTPYNSVDMELIDQRVRVNVMGELYKSEFKPKKFTRQINFKRDT